MTAIKSKRADLRDVQGRLRDQMRLCQEEVGLGGKWGSKAVGSGPSLSSTPLIDTKALRELDAMFSGELHVSDPSDLALPTTEEEISEDEEQPSPAPAPVVEVATAPPPVVDPTPAPPEIPTGEGKDDDFDSILSGISTPTEVSGKRPSLSVDELLDSLLDP